MAVTMRCAFCDGTFTRTGRQTFCTDACRAAAYRRRRMAARPFVVIPPQIPRVPSTIYECDSCGARALGTQRCTDCRTFMRRVDIGGACPHCDEPITVAELIGREVSH
jgi:phage FluMu protein Com